MTMQLFLDDLTQTIEVQLVPVSCLQIVQVGLCWQMIPAGANDLAALQMLTRPLISINHLEQILQKCQVKRLGWLSRGRTNACRSVLNVLLMHGNYSITLFPCAAHEHAADADMVHENWS